MAKKAKYEADHVFSRCDMPWFKFFWKDKAAFIELLDNEDAGRVLKAIAAYCSGKDPEELDSKLAAAVFALFKRDIDSCYERYVQQVVNGKNAPQNRGGFDHGADHTNESYPGEMP